VTTTAHGFASACETLFPQIFGGREEGKKKIGSILQKGIRALTNEKLVHTQS
jgi:hypothetical protein